MPVKKLTVADREQAYTKKESITNLLPWLEYSSETGCFLLNDGQSLGACLKLTLVPVEGRPESFLDDLVTQITNAIAETIPQVKDNPYVVQCYVQDEQNLTAYYQTIKQYVKEGLQDEPITQKHLDIMQSHFEFLTRDGGAFYDSQVTGTTFSGKVRTVRIVIYRWLRETKNKARSEHTPLKELQLITQRFKDQVSNLRLKAELVNGEDFYQWMVKWFNPKPKAFNDDINQLLASCPYPDDELPFGWDLSEQVFFNEPESDEPYWLFDGMYHSMVGLQSLQRSPKAGHLTAELSHIDNTYSLMDKMPEGTILNITFVIKHEDETKAHLKKVEQSARGNKALAVATREQALAAEHGLSRGRKIYPAMVNIYLRADSRDGIVRCEEAVTALMNVHGMRIINVNNELVPLHNYLTFVPMNYDYYFDQKNLYRSRFMYLDDIAKLLPFYGRERGTHHPNFVFYNRGGEPISFDPLKDKANSAHLFLVGDTGTGKSNLMATMIASTLAIHNPYFVILEAGGSFDVMGDFFKEHGKSINHVDFQDDVSLNPFADALTALSKFEQAEKDEEAFLSQALDAVDETIDNLNKPEKPEDNVPEPDDVERDYFSEMALALRLMVTGGNPKEEEKFARADSMILMDALMQAAKEVRASNKEQVLITDVLDAMEVMIAEYDEVRDIDIIKRLREMHNNIRYFTRDYTARRFFNRPGKTWPTMDITLVNLQKFVGSGEEKALYLALAVIGCLNKVLAFAEANQSNGRDTVLVIDEAHVLTKNPIIAAILVLVAKMARKFGLWLWIATQHVQDFKDESTKILSMLETWICLCVGGQSQIDEIKRFKTLTEEQESLLRNAKKEDGLYSEGVLLAQKLTALFRNVPPREYLSLVMTNPEQKYKRKQLMEKHHITEQEAALIMADEMKQKNSNKKD